MAEHRENKEDPKSTQILEDEYNKELDAEKGDSSDETLRGAQDATAQEHSMSLLEGLKKYPKACAWSVMFSSALIMEGFDKAFITAFFAFPAFQRRYGQLTAEGDYQVPASQQAAIGNCVNVGQIIGLLLNGYLADKFGYRSVMLSCLFLMMCFIFLQFFATNIWMYLGAGILLGIPWGAFQTVTTTYAAEVCPTVLRPYLTMCVSMCWSIGYLVGTATLRGFLSMEGQWAYRIPFAMQWILPIPLAIGTFFAPDSPWWLVRKNRSADAERALRRLRTNPVDEEVHSTLQMIEFTVNLEREQSGHSRYIDMVNPKNLRRTEITVFTYVIQELCVPLLSYVVYFLQQAGVPTERSFDFSIGQYGLAILGVIIAWSVVRKFGRRTMLLTGTTFVAVTTLVIGCLGIRNTVTNTQYAYAIGSILLVQYFFFFITVGPIVYTIVTEIPNNFLRTKSVAVARATYNVNVLIYGQLVPRMIQRSTWNWGAKSGFFYGGIMLIGLAWAYFRLPETKDRTFAEIDILFENKVAARDFVKTKVDLATKTVSRYDSEDQQQ